VKNPPGSSSQFLTRRACLKGRRCEHNPRVKSKESKRQISRSFAIIRNRRETQRMTKIGSSSLVPGCLEDCCTESSEYGRGTAGNATKERMRDKVSLGRRSKYGLFVLPPRSHPEPRHSPICRSDHSRWCEKNRLHVPQSIFWTEQWPRVNSNVWFSTGCIIHRVPGSLWNWIRIPTQHQRERVL